MIRSSLTPKLPLVNTFFIDKSFPERHSGVMLGEDLNSDVLRSGPAPRSRVVISVPTDEDGHPQWDKAKDAAKDSWRKVAGAEETKQFFGDGPAEVPLVVTPLMASSLVSSFFRIEGVFFALRYKIPQNEAESLFALTPSEDKAITPVAQVVLSKQAPDFMLKWGNEVTLAFLLVNASVARDQAARAWAAEHKKSETVEAQPVPTDGGAGQIWVAPEIGATS